MGFLSSALYFVLLKRENERRNRGERDEIIEGVQNRFANAGNGIYQNVAEAKSARGDNWSGFRYTL